MAREIKYKNKTIELEGEAREAFSRVERILNTPSTREPYIGSNEWIINLLVELEIMGVKCNRCCKTYLKKPESGFCNLGDIYEQHPIVYHKFDEEVKPCV